MKRTPILFLFVFAAASAAGCYTILSHPGPAVDLSDDEGMRRPCADCHTDLDLDHLPGTHDNGWYQYYPAPWATYYSAPWWYGDDWWRHRHDRPDSPATPPAEVGGRHVWTRDSGSAGLSPPRGNVNAAPSDSGRAKDASNPPQKPANEKPKEQEQKKEKRHVWGR